MENNRRKFHNDIECVKTGLANGSALDRPLTDEEKQQMIEEATEHFGNFLTALKCDWQNDPNSADTPRRVAKKYLEQWGGRYNTPPEVTSFPSDGYTGMVLQTNIPLISMCSHHHETILGKVHIAYIPGKDARVIGLSKLNRLVEHFGRRGAIQEQLTIAIHQAVDKVCEGNIGVAVTIIGEHQCVSCRGTNHQGSAMVTNHLTGVFMDKSEVRAEYFKSVELASSHIRNS
jgi:GTP cyclohydrolase I